MIDILHISEKKKIELKEASHGVPKSIYETISSFANTSGGIIVLGVKEGKGRNVILGINNALQYKKDILNAVHNKQKVSYPIIDDTDFEECSVDGKTILLIHVKEADKRFKPIYINGSLGESFGRSEDGDYHLSNNQIKYMLNDNNEDSYDSLPNSMGYVFEDIDERTIASYRKELNETYPNNIYVGLDDYSFMQKTGLLVLNGDNKYVLTNSAVILFTDNTKITSIFPNYLLDYQRNDSGLSKWDRRIVTDEPIFSGNLFDFYELVINDLLKDIPSSYVAVDGHNAGYALMVDCFKEALANAFSNHSFYLSGPLKILRTKNELLVRNSGKMLVEKSRAIMGGVSRARNQSIISCFRRIGVADRSGTGIPKMFEAMKKNNFLQPIIIDGNDREDYTILRLIFDAVGKDASEGINKKIIDIVSLYGDEGVSIGDIASKLDASRGYISKMVDGLIRKGVLSDNGKPTKGKKILLK